MSYWSEDEQIEWRQRKREERLAQKQREKELRRWRYQEHAKQFTKMPTAEWRAIAKSICWKKDLKYWVGEAFHGEFNYWYERHGASWGAAYTYKSCKPFYRTWIKRGLEHYFGKQLQKSERLITYLLGDEEAHERMNPIFRTLCMIQIDLINQALKEKNEPS